MTRINVVPPFELTTKHLVAEYRELPRIFTLAKRYRHPSEIDIPPVYTLGKGHMKFFCDKLGWLVKRQQALIDEMKARGYKPQFGVENLLDGIDKAFIGDYIVTMQALEINRFALTNNCKRLKMSNLYIIRGLPGSGKTTFVKSLGLGTHCEADQFPGLYRDGIFHPELLSEAHRWCFENAMNALNHSPHVFVSNTFTRRWEIQSYYDEATKNGHRVFVLMVEGDHANGHGVPNEKINAMIDRWESW